jgi:hypothetical protein
VTIQSDLGCPVLPRKTFRFLEPPNQWLPPARPVPTRGALRPIVTKRGAGCGGRGSARRRTALTRTAKPCGPDAPTLASSFAEFSARRRWQESPVTEESTEQAVKTIAQGRPGVTGEPVVTTLVCFSFCTRGYGCGGHPAFPAPSFIRGTRCLHRSGANSVARPWTRAPNAMKALAVCNQS